MGSDGSGPPRHAIPPPSLPPLLSLGAVFLGVLGMQVVSFLVLRYGLRPALVASEAALVAPGLIALLAFRLPPRNALALHRPSGRALLLVAATGASLWAASLGLFELQSTLVSFPAWYLETFKRLHDALRPSGPADALVSILAIAVAPAVCEETLMRGIVLPSLLRWGAVTAVLGSAAVFSLIHVDPYRSLFTFALGVALGVLRLRTGSLVPPVIAHAVLNTITFLAAPLAGDPTQGLPEPQPLLGTGLFVAGALATGVLLRALASVDPSPTGT